jgi:hypothetical protein
MTQSPPIKSDTSRPQCDFALDALYLLYQESCARFSVHALPPCFMLQVKLADGRMYPRLLPRPGPVKGFTVMMKLPGFAPEWPLIGLSLEDAQARAERLNLPGRPDGFHLWN